MGGDDVQTRSRKEKGKGGAGVDEEPTLKEVLEAVSNMTKKLDSMCTKYDTVLDKLDTKVSAHDVEISKCQDDVVSLESKYDQLHDAHLVLVQKFENYVNNTSARFDREEQYSRRNSVRIAGLKVDKGESTDEAVLKLANVIAAGTTINDISRSHFTKGKQFNGAKQIIVRFVSYRARIAFITKRSALRSIAKGDDFADVFINEDLTSRRLKLLMQARKCVKEGRIWSTWTNDGNIWYKIKKDGELERINKDSDLQKVQQLPVIHKRS